MSAGQIYFILFLIAATNVVTWEVHSWKDGADRTATVEKEVKVTEKAQKDTNALVGSADDKLANLDATIDSLKENYHAETSTPCQLPAPDLRLLGGIAAAARRAAQ
jgi:TolA-binding protein